MPPVAADNKGFKMTSTPGPGGCVVRVEGVINQEFDGQRLANAGGVVVVDLGEVHRITSYGVRAWIDTMARMNCQYLCFIHCRPALVCQFNTVAQFGGTGQVLSFYAPYVCGGCGAESQVLIDVRRQYEDIRALLLPDVRCSACGAATEFDDDPASYLSYVAQSPNPKVPTLVDALLSGTADTPKAPLKVDKEVRGEVTGFRLSGEVTQAASLKRAADGLEGSVVVLLGGVTRLTPEGSERLQALLMPREAKVYAAHVPLHMAEFWAEQPAVRCGKAKVLSVEAPFVCSVCHHPANVSVSQEELRALVSKAPARHSCLSCGGVMAVAMVDERVKRLLVLPWAAIPPEVVEYLEQKPFERPAASSTERAPELFGRYQLVRRLGSGGMAEVYLAKQTAAGGFEKKVVLKRILKSLSADPAFVQMFLREARLAARISHPNVVQIFDLGQVGEEYFIAMEYVRGWDLNVLLKIGSKINVPLPLEVACRVVADVCAGLHAAHTYVDDAEQPVGIIHRDVSPHNVLVATTGEVKLTDFGIARALDSAERTPSHALSGKISYAAPEQLRSQATPLDHRGDLFAASIILYQCLTLEHPFRRENEYATMRAILFDPVPKVAPRRPELGEKVDAILERGLARYPADRYPSAREMQRDLERLAVDGAQPTDAGKVAEWVSRLIAEAEALGQMPQDLITRTERPGKETPGRSAADRLERTSTLVRMKPDKI